MNDRRRRRRRHFWGSSLGLRLSLISSRYAVMRSQLLLREELLLSQELSTSIALSIPRSPFLTGVLPWTIGGVHVIGSVCSLGGRIESTWGNRLESLRDHIFY